MTIYAEETGLSLPDRSTTDETILTTAQRRERYRQKLQAHQKDRGIRLKEFLLQKRRYLRMLDIVARRKRAEDVDLMCRYYNGDQYGSYDDFGLYLDRRQEGDYAYAIPVLSGHVDQAFLQLLKVKPEYTIAANDKDDPTTKLVASMCEDLGVRELKRVMGPVSHSEFYNLLLSGESVRIVGWKPNPVSPRKVKRPQYNGSTYTDSNEVALGENCVHVPHMLAIQKDMSAIEPEESTFMVEYSYIDKHVAEWEYQSEITPTTEGLPIEMQLRFDLERGSNQTDAIIGTARLAPLGREGGFGVGGGSSQAPFYKQPQELHYWDASQFGQFISDHDEQLPDGTIIPKGTVLGDHFPQGAFVLFVGDTIMDVKACVRRRKVTHIRYGRIAGTNSGAGLKKAMPMQDAENDNFNLNQTVKHTVGHPLTVIDGHFVNELPGPGNVLKITRAGLDDIGKVVKQFPGQSVNQGDNAQVIIESAMQFIAGTNTVGGGSVGGAPDMRAAGTATGIAAMQEQAAGRQSHAVDQRIMADQEMILQLLENIQEYSTAEQKKELEKIYGVDIVKAFFNTDLRQTVTVGIKTNSEMPRSMALATANYIAFANAVAQVMPVAQGNPWIMEFLEGIATSMGFPFSVGEGRNDRREAEYRLNVLTEIEQRVTAHNPLLLTNSMELAKEMYGQLAKKCNPLIATPEEAADPEAGSTDSGMPRVWMQVHESFMDVYKDALFSEKAKSWSEAHRLVVLQLWVDHHKADMERQATIASMQAAADQAANPPDQPTEDAAKAEELAAQREAAADQREMQIKGAEHEMNEAEEDAALERDLRMQRSEHHYTTIEEDASLDRDLARIAEQAKLAKQNQQHGAKSKSK